ncbi:TRAP transporter small permease [Roseococcus sp. YIM B11640]|uniref:TRAP transporter small permease n=1 Tax=Roseococcus sp. YIM B11640 TaxID=3133973 RepID=UPI003C7D2426
MKAIAAGLGALAALLRWSLIVATAAMLVLIFLQVVMRYVFSHALAWSEELALLAFSWATMGGLALGVREGFHVRLTLLTDRFPPRAAVAWEAGVNLLTAALGAYLAWSGLRFMEFTAGSTSAAMEYPIEILNVMAPIAGGLVCLFALGRIALPAPPPVATAEA